MKLINITTRCLIHFLLYCNESLMPHSRLSMLSVNQILPFPALNRVKRPKRENGFHRKEQETPNYTTLIHPITPHSQPLPFKPTNQTVFFNPMELHESIYVVAIALSLCILVTIEVKGIMPSLRDSTLLENVVRKKMNYDIITNDKGETVSSQFLSSPIQPVESTTALRCRFSVIIVTFNEPLLNKT